MRKLVHPILSADFKISETYRRASTAPLPCPVYFSGGKEDPRIRQDNVEVWKETVAKPEHCHIRWFKGGHNYLFNAKESKTEFLDYLTAQIKACLEQQGTETGLESGGTGIENGVARSQPSLPPSQSEHSDHLEKSVTQHPTPDCGASIQSGSDAGATVGSNSSYALTSSTKVTPPLTSYSPPPLAQIHTDSDMQTENAQERENERSEKAVERKSFFRWLCGRAL